MQQLVELGRVDAADRLRAGDQPLADHRDRRFDCRGGCALGRARLQEVQASVLDRELDVLDIAVVALQSLHRCDELLECLGHQLAQPRDRLRRADSRDDILSLGIQQELAVQPRLARGRVAGEADAGRRTLILVAEDHAADVDRSAEVVRDLVGVPVDLGARGVPGLEDRPHGSHELVERSLGERIAGLLAEDREVRLDQLAEGFGAQVDIGRRAAALLERTELGLEALPFDALDDLAVHLDQPPVGVTREALVARHARETEHGLVVESEIEDCVHHSRHRDRRARAN